MEVDNTTMLLGPQGIRPLHLHAPVLPRKCDMMACAVSNSAWRKVQQASQVVVPQTTPTDSVVTSVIRVVMTPCRPSKHGGGSGRCGPCDYDGGSNDSYDYGAGKPKGGRGCYGGCKGRGGYNKKN